MLVQIVRQVFLTTNQTAQRAKDRTWIPVQLCASMPASIYCDFQIGSEIPHIFLVEGNFAIQHAIEIFSLFIPFYVSDPATYNWVTLAIPSPLLYEFFRRSQIFAHVEKMTN